MEKRRIFAGVRPDHGGRIELKLCNASDTRASYTVSILTPHAELTTEAMADAQSGAVELGEWQGGPPPAWLEGLAKTLLRTVLRGKNSDGAWSRRVTRWRPDPKP